MCLLIFKLGLFFVGESFQDAVKLGGTALESGNNVLGRALEKSDNVGDKLVLALDVSEGLQLVLTYIYCLLYISAFQHGESVLLIAELLDEFRRSVTRIAEHESSLAMQQVVEFGVIDFSFLESLLEKSILHAEHLDALLEAGAAERACLLGVETGCLHQVNAGIFAERITDHVYDDCFIFLFHVFYDVLKNYSATDLASIFTPGLMVLER